MRHSIQESRGKKKFTCLFRKGFNYFICILSFSLRVYLVLAESKIEKQFSSQIDLHCGFFRVSVNIRTFISFQMFMGPGRNVSVGFT